MINGQMRRWILFFLLTAGCATSLPALPSKGGPAWSSLVSEHFILWTDLPPVEAERQLQSLEEYRSVLIAFAMKVQPAGVRGRSVAICLGREREWAYFAPKDLVGIFFPADSNPLRLPVIVYPASVVGGHDADAVAVRQHELVHLILFSIMRKQPRWFAEGMAYFFQATAIDPTTHEVEIGGAPEDLMRRLKDLLHYNAGWRLLPLHEVFAPPDNETIRSVDFYTTSWWLVSFLINQRAEEFAKYQRLLVERPDADPEDSWAEAFPDLPPDAAERALVSWRTIGAELHVKKFVHNFPAAKLLAMERLKDPDVHVVRGLLEQLMRKDPVASRREMAEALGDDPTNVGATMVLRSLGDTIDATRARALVAAHPKDWMATTLLFDALPPGADRDELGYKLCAQLRDNPSIYLGEGFCKAVDMTESQ
jgi:hypothetical protein